MTDPKNAKLHTLNLKIKTLTPVSVGTGETLKAKVDVVFEGDKAKYINLPKLYKRMENSMTDISDYFADEVFERVYAGESVDVWKFINDNIKDLEPDKDDKSDSTDKEDKLKKFIYAEAKSYLLGNKRSAEIQAICKENGVPYIPGSSLKGSIKTALFYYWMVEKEEGKAWIKDKIINLVNTDNLFERETNRKLLAEALSKELRALSDKEIEEEQYALGIYNPTQLRVSDVFFTKKSLAIYETKKIRLIAKQDDKKNISNTIEAIDYAKEATHFRLDTIHSQEYFFKALRRFAKDSLAYDLDTTEYKELEKWHLQEYKEELEDLQDKVQSGQTLLRVGWGKSYFYQAVGLAIWNYSDKGKEFFRRFRRAYANENPQFKKSIPFMYFPVMRTVTSRRQMPLGWLRLMTEKEWEESEAEKSQEEAEHLVEEAGEPEVPKEEAESNDSETLDPEKHVLISREALKQGSGITSAQITRLEKKDKRVLLYLEGEEPFEVKLQIKRSDFITVKLGKIIKVRVPKLKPNKPIFVVNYVPKENE